MSETQPAYSPAACIRDVPLSLSLSHSHNGSGTNDSIRGHGAVGVSVLSAVLDRIRMV